MENKFKKVDLSVSGPGYVFEADYDLASLEEIESFVNKNKHFPEVSSAAEKCRNTELNGEK